MCCCVNIHINYNWTTQAMILSSWYSRMPCLFVINKKKFRTWRCLLETTQLYIFVGSSPLSRISKDFFPTVLCEGERNKANELKAIRAIQTYIRRLQELSMPKPAFHISVKLNFSEKLFIYLIFFSKTLTLSHVEFEENKKLRYRRTPYQALFKLSVPLNLFKKFLLLPDYDNYPRK